jgi:hypothetical protein
MRLSAVHYARSRLEGSSYTPTSAAAAGYRTPGVLRGGLLGRGPTGQTRSLFFLFFGFFCFFFVFLKNHISLDIFSQREIL